MNAKDPEQMVDCQTALIKSAATALRMQMKDRGQSILENEVRFFAGELIDQLVSIESIQEEAEEHSVIRLGPGGWKSTSSHKLSNIRFNLQKLPLLATSSALTVGGVLTTPWLIPFAALWCLLSVIDVGRVEITEREALVLWTLWSNRDAENQVLVTETTSMVAEECRKANRSAPTDTELDHALDALCKLKTISKTTDGRNWLLAESVTVCF